MLFNYILYGCWVKNKRGALQINEVHCIFGKKSNTRVDSFIHCGGRIKKYIFICHCHGHNSVSMHIYLLAVFVSFTSWITRSCQNKHLQTTAVLCLHANFEQKRPLETSLTHPWQKHVHKWIQLAPSYLCTYLQWCVLLNMNENDK